MNDSKPTPPITEKQPSEVHSGLSRRRLVRAGLTAAPVMAALKSNTVLAGGYNCIRPSSFASTGAATIRNSNGATIRNDYRCKSHGHWKNKQGSLPANFKSRRFLNHGNVLTGFHENPGQSYTDLTLQQVLELEGHVPMAKLARHVVAAYLSATEINDDFELVWLTRQQCCDIWNGQGVWTPIAGSPSWTLAQTLDYFEMAYG